MKRKQVMAAALAVVMAAGSMLTGCGTTAWKVSPNA